MKTKIFVAISVLIIIVALFILNRLYSFEVSANALIFYDLKIQDSRISFEVSQTDSGYPLKGYTYSIRDATLKIQFYGTLLNKYAMRSSTVIIEGLPEIQRIECHTTKGNSKTIWEAT